MKLELFINNENIEIDTSVIAPLTYSIADIKTPESRSRNRSKTIKIKGTQSNLQVMFSAYSLSLQDTGVGFDFDPNSELPAMILRNGYTIFNGVARFVNVIKKKGKYEFNFQIFGNSVGLFELLGDRTLSDLGWSEYNHNLTIANLELTWDTSVDVDGVPTSNFTAGNPDGFGYVYHLANYGYSALQEAPRTNALIPYFYMVEAFKKCFAVGGYTIIGDWIDETLIKRIIFGQGGGERITLTSGEIADRLVDYTVTGGLATTLSGAVLPWNSNTSGNIRVSYSSSILHFVKTASPFVTALVDDTRLQYDDPSGIITVGSAGNYDIEFNTTLLIVFDYFGGSAISENKKGFATLWILVNNTVVAQVRNESKTGVEVRNLKTQKYLNAGDEVRFMFRTEVLSNLTYVTVANIADAPTLDFNFTVNSASINMTSIDAGLLEGDPVEISRWMPEMKCRDFVNDIILMNNLYLSDPNDDDEVRVEPFEDYYLGSDEAENWTMKLDHEEDIEISSNAGIDGKVYKFKFAEDRDSYKQDYFDKWGSDYGDLDYTVPSTFKKGDKVYQTKFAQTIPVELTGTTLILPQIVKKNATTGISSPHKGKPRIMIYNGLQTGAWNLLNSTNGLPTAQTTYPQAHHVDDVSNPTFDLNFGIPIEVNYTATQYTNNNLFGKYYTKHIKELTSRDSKFLTAKFKLDESDLQDEFMRTLVNINGVVYRKNVIRDFDATGFQTTEVELIKILEADSTPTRRMYAVDYDTHATDSARLITTPPINQTNNGSGVLTIDFFTENVTVIDTSGGSGTVTVANAMREGTEKTIIRNGSNDVTITAESGNISGQASILLGVDYDSTTLVFIDGGWFVKDGATGIGGGDVSVEITTNTTASTSVDVYLVDTEASTITVTLPITGVVSGKTWNIKKIHENFSLIITSSNPSTVKIDDEESKIIRTKNTNAVIYYDGSNYRIL